MLTIPGYQINSQIYESLNSLVLKGLRKKDEHPVILKMLKEDYPTPTELARYQQEYEITRDLDLVGVIKVYGIEKYQNTLVIILEDFGGESLKQLIIDRPLMVKEFLPLAIQIADSLGHIHAANLIHKDINPSNIIWEPVSKQLKIIDFGIASRLQRENPTLKNPEQLEGTLAYLSPEQTGRINRSIDYRTDLYSLGITYYELLTGFLPFAATDTIELVHCHIAKIPPSVNEVNANVPSIISDIVMKLMAKNAEDRYQSAFGLKVDLEKCFENLQCVENLEGLSFELAQNDFFGKLQIPQKLYGRDLEVNTLLQAFERVGDGATEMILVAGYSGVGKTALVHEVHKPMTSKRGYFAAGKFDQFQRSIPYFAITQAFNAFCDYLLTESDKQLQIWREMIETAIKPNGQVLIEVIPYLESIIGPQPTVVEVGPQEAQNRLNLVFQKFFRAICQAEHPLILFIDDLQWADSASLKLLNTLMTDTEAKYFLMIGAYRDNEVSAAHPLMLTLDEIQKAGTIINTIQLQNLSDKSVSTLIAETLNVQTIEVSDLTDLIYEKTHGNAFFTHEFLKSLYEQSLLNYEVKTKKWQWAIDSIRALEVTSNVVELMAGKIAQLPTESQMVLKLASCIGTQFDLETLAIIYQHEPKSTLAYLWSAIEEGLVLPLDDHYKQLEGVETSNLIPHFHFRHDRIQQAANSLIAQADKKVIHLKIGRLLLANKAFKEHLFDVVNQLNEGRDLITEPAEKQKLITLNLAAGKKAKSSSAYQQAKQYLNMSLELLDQDSWQTQYELTKTIYEEIAEATYLCTEFKETVRLINEVLQHAKTVLDQVKVYEIQMQAYTAQNELLKVVETMLSVLKLLGIVFPDQPTESDTQHYLEKTLFLVGERSIESLIALPQMTEPEKLAAMQIMSKGWYTSAMANSACFPLIGFEMVYLSLKYGNSLTSTYAYAVGGLMFCSMGNIDKGFQFGQLALSVLEQFNAIELKAKVFDIVSIATRIWKEPVKDTLKFFLEAYQSGVETGDLEIAAQSAFDYLFNAYLVGTPLPWLQKETVTYVEAVKQTKQENVILYVLVVQQTVLNLVEYTENPTELIGSAYHEKTMFSSFGEDLAGIFVFYLEKLILSYLFHESTNIFENAAKIEPISENMAGTFYMAIFYFYHALAQLAVFPEVTEEQQKSMLDKVTAYQEAMQNWAFHAPMNFQHKYDLVEAEKARILGQDLAAMDFYEKAIAGAKKNQYLQEEALAYELAGRFYLARGMDKFAQTYLREAHYAYQQWGAITKVKDLETRYPQWLTQKSTPAIPTMLTETSTVTVMASTLTQIQSSNWLDLETIIKASQTLSGEIVLAQLLKKMMHIVIENAGAQRGFLILPLEDKWVIEAEGAIDKEEVTVLHLLPVENRLPKAIISYVARTQENVVLANARQEGLYTDNPYIKTHQTQSVLCFPIVYQQQLRAILYFENNLTTGAFTPQRLSVLKMLSSQIAISLENAQYATQLEDKVKQRTAELAEANQHILALNEKLKEENLRMSAELEVAKQLQQMVLPKEAELAQIDTLEIAGFMEPADEVGGDYYEVLNHDGHIKIGIGDVTGHGLESGVLMLMVQTTVRALLLAGIDNPERFLNVINRTIYHNAQRMETDKNLTLSLLDYQEGQLQITGQHEEVLVVRQSGEVERIDTINLGFMVGVTPNITRMSSHKNIQLQKGDGIVLYTDGITEAQNIEEEQYGLARLCEVVSHLWPLTAQEIQQAVIANVKQFIGTQKVFDDITLLILKQK